MDAWWKSHVGRKPVLREYMGHVLLRDTDQMSMAHGLEVRVPLLNHTLVEYLMGLPDACKRSHGTPKRFLVESLDGLPRRDRPSAQAGLHPTLRVMDAGRAAAVL
jgi:asparagine synthetase B (glutamine-hydrolysing)